MPQLSPEQAEQRSSWTTETDSGGGLLLLLKVEAGEISVETQPTDWQSLQTRSHHKHKGSWMATSAAPALEAMHEVQTSQLN